MIDFACTADSDDWDDDEGWEEEVEEAEEDDWDQDIFDDLGPPTTLNPSGAWFGSLNEVGDAIAEWAGCSRVWSEVSGDVELLLQRCPTCSIEEKSYDSNYPGGSGYEYLVRTKEGPLFRRQFREQVLRLFRGDQGKGNG